MVTVRQACIEGVGLRAGLCVRMGAERADLKVRESIMDEVGCPEAMFRREGGIRA